MGEKLEIISKVYLSPFVWRQTAENLAKYMKKGSMIGVDGRIQTRSYDNQEGKRVYVTEVLAETIQFLESRGSSQQPQGSPSGYNQNEQQQRPAQPTGQSSQQQPNHPFQNDGEQIDISDDDLPF